ncbi:hypothetical protein H072_11089 [Dactylellina haptotyla CBS 200.50]|uniref:Prion-inhibition and propagation HeLo domain-containing protein n=1 Tax=Dactylellina haptotyla (strain CBS 200.50) TaxID=1284197 RepID=S8B8X9_DACHA|nr:hypothetical protein H072_11089 [Dactylellina haptotyla CBS 200.50]
MGPPAAAIQSQNRDLGTLQNGETALRILEHIKQLFEETRRLSLKYKGDPALCDPVDGIGRDARRFVAAVRNVVTRRQRNYRMLQRTTWAVYDKNKFNRLLDDVTELVDGLVRLFPSESERESGTTAIATVGSAIRQKQEALYEEDLDFLITQKKNSCRITRKRCHQYRRDSQG